MSEEPDYLCVLKQHRWDKMLDAMNEVLTDGGYGPVARPHALFSTKHFRTVPIEWMNRADYGPTAPSGKWVGVYVIPIDEVTIGND